jgi:hypothetical protein
MKVVDFEGTNIYVNKLLPFKGFWAMMLFGFIFMREEYMDYLTDGRKKPSTRKMVNHENIHKEQIKDFGLPFFWCPPLQILFGGIIFYLIYILEWFIRLFINGPKNAYRNISFEQEAYNHELDFKYIQEERKHFNQWCKEKTRQD